MSKKKIETTVTEETNVPTVEADDLLEAANKQPCPVKAIKNCPHLQITIGEIFFILDEIESLGKFDEYTGMKLKEIGERLQ